LKRPAIAPIIAQALGPEPSLGKPGEVETGREQSGMARDIA